MNTEPTEPTVEPTTEPVVEPTVEPNEVAAQKTFTQDEVDAIIKKRLVRQDKKEPTTNVLEEYGFKTKEEFGNFVETTKSLSAELQDERRTNQEKKVMDLFGKHNITEESHITKLKTLSTVSEGNTPLEKLENAIQQYGFIATPSKVGADHNNANNPNDGESEFLKAFRNKKRR